jgi:hypothetical protein
VELALKDCKLMFVFLSLNSIHSSWVPFEAGFAYSKGIRVVPVGCFGMDLGQAVPPMSLLQGFNISNVGGLNNILATINDDFECNHAESFTDVAFQSFSSLAEAHGTYGATDLLDDISCQVMISKEDAFDLATSLLESEGILVARNESEVVAFGLHLFLGHEGLRNQVPRHLNFKLGFERLSTNLPAIFLIARRVGNIKNPSLKLTMRFADDVTAILKGHKISDRLFGTAVDLNSKTRFGFRGITFDLNQEFSVGMGHSSRLGNFYLTMDGKENQLTTSNISDLIQLLVDRGIVIQSMPFGL